MAPVPTSSRVLRAKHLPQSAFTSASTIPIRPRTMQLPSSVPMQVVPPTPAAQLDDPFSRLPVPSTSAPTAPAPAKPSKQGKTEFTLRLPPGLVRPKTVAGSTQAAVPSGPLYSMPTLSPQYTHPGGYARGASYSVPGRQVAFNPFFDTIRQNLELGSRSRDSQSADGEGIPLKLPRRVRRRVGELPFEWLRQIARKSRHATESSSSTSSSSESDLGSDSDSLSDMQGVLPSEGPSSTSKAVSESYMQTPSVPRPSQARISTTVPRSTLRSPSSSPQPIPIPRLSKPRSGSPSSPTSSSLSHSPPDADDLTRALELQFYKIELGEQKRLLGVMERHSMESGKVIHEGSGVRGSLGIPTVGMDIKPGEDSKSAAQTSEEAIASFPFSITAGLEKGSKNRYRNIWPFEHARVRLRKTKPDDDDYMNASYVQPLGTTKRYIATQGPLPTTFTDFWTLCWEQNVHVIVMLTREIEGSTVKCGKYWDEGTYGTLRLRLLETNDTPERERQRRERETSGGFFSTHVPQPKPKLKPKAKGKGEDVDMADAENPSTIKRVFELTNTAYPLAPPRIVTQFQYLEWPDLNVPNDPRGVLELMRQVEDAVEKSRSSGQKPWGEGPLYRKSGGSEPTLGSTVVAAKGKTMDQVDPLTGVALVAQENAPVLLHCSAGVGRTGGFIAVDAVLDGVRREMRKRREAVDQETADAKAASDLQGRSGTASRSNSRSRSRSMSVVSQTPEPMDVDSSASPPPQQSAAPALTMAVPVGDREVHVPVAGFAQSEPTPMDVDERVPVPPVVSKHATLPPPLLQASPELVAEVRRATLNSWPSMPVANVQAERQHDPSESSFDSYAMRRSSSRSGPTSRTRTRSSASPPTSHSESATSAMVGQTAKLSMKSPSPPSESAPLPPEDLRARTVSLLSSMSSHAEPEAQNPRPSIAAHRLNTWRSEVHSSSDYACKNQDDAAVEVPLCSAVAAVEPHTSSTSKAVDKGASDSGESSPPLREPRRLHDDASPPLLSTYDEPIRRVIEDMREQRMSLCQSLRQYVFVHRAIIEGALMVVDEEKRRARKAGAVEGEGLARTTDKARKKHRRASKDRPASVARGSSVPRPSSAAAGALPSAVSASSSTQSDYGGSGSNSTAIETIIEGVVSPATVASPRSKRSASPTELRMEGVDGGVLLTKRPSLKRRQRTGEGLAMVPPASSATQ
ncbi:hypothetical protein C8Q76DRAFT_714283 [Earliella scabrosa]|nr:hypothetical protein C8Q76DRAFT_714283 [Earliella scabrosa]